MTNYLERLGRKLTQDALKRVGETLIDFCHDQVPILKPALEELQNGTRRHPKSKIKQSERSIRDRLAAQIPYSQKEVSTESGRIDILTPHQVIEVKNVRQYKHAIGQVISYSHYYPKHERCIYLFGKVSAKQRQLIEAECKNEKITVIFV